MNIPINIGGVPVAVPIPIGDASSPAPGGVSVVPIAPSGGDMGDIFGSIFGSIVNPFWPLPTIPTIPTTGTTGGTGTGTGGGGTTGGTGGGLGGALGLPSVQDVEKGAQEFAGMAEREIVRMAIFGGLILLLLVALFALIVPKDTINEIQEVGKTAAMAALVE